MEPPGSLCPMRPGLGELYLSIRYNMIAVERIGAIVACEAHPRDNRVLSTAHLRIKCGPSWRRVPNPPNGLRGSRRVLAWLRIVREASRRSVVAEQGRLIVFPNWPLKKSSSESLTPRPQARTSFRLGWLISSLGDCLHRKAGASARSAGPAIILCALRGFTRLKMQRSEERRH